MDTLSFADKRKIFNAIPVIKPRAPKAPTSASQPAIDSSMVEKSERSTPSILNPPSGKMNLLKYL
jgi:hypothetical protein